MGLLESARKNSLIPSFLYGYPSQNSDSVATTLPVRRRSFIVSAPREPRKKIEVNSIDPMPLINSLVALSAKVGMFSCGLTHVAVTPLDLLKCNMQIDPGKYKSISSGFRVLLKEQGVRGLYRGLSPTFYSYSTVGLCTNELIYMFISDLASPMAAAKYLAMTSLVAEVLRCPFEAVKVRIQTQTGFAKDFFDCVPKLYRSEGALGFYKGLIPLLGRQIPYTMVKFCSFEPIVDTIYKFTIPTPRHECTRSLQLCVSFAGGYVAGIFAAIVSHPADNLVTFVYNAKGATVSEGVKKLGLRGLFTHGLPLRIFMIGTLSAAQWGIYDALRLFMGTPPAAAALMAIAKGLID